MLTPFGINLNIKQWEAATEKGRVNRGPVGYFSSGGEGCLSPDSGASVGSSFSITVMNSPLVTHSLFSIERITKARVKLTFDGSQPVAFLLTDGLLQGCNG